MGFGAALSSPLNRRGSLMRKYLHSQSQILSLFSFPLNFNREMRWWSPFFLYQWDHVCGMQNPVYVILISIQWKRGIWVFWVFQALFSLIDFVHKLIPSYLPLGKFLLVAQTTLRRIRTLISPKKELEPWLIFHPILTLKLRISTLTN